MNTLPANRGEPHTNTSQETPTLEVTIRHLKRFCGATPTDLAIPLPRPSPVIIGTSGGFRTVTVSTLPSYSTRHHGPRVHEYYVACFYLGEPTHFPDCGVSPQNALNVTKRHPYFAWAWTIHLTPVDLNSISQSVPVDSLTIPQSRLLSRADAAHVCTLLSPCTPKWRVWEV